MASFNDYLYPLDEAHVRLSYNGDSFHLDGLDGPDNLLLPELYQRGLRALYNLLESMAPQLTCVCVSGIWFSQSTTSPFVAFDIWLQQEEEGFYLPFSVKTAFPISTNP
jgi:hypothetical protein